MADLDRVARMTNDEYLRPWWWMADDLQGWLRREIAEERGPSRAISPSDETIAHSEGSRCDCPSPASEAVRCAAVRTGDQPAGELSYWLLPEARGRGLAVTAVTEMMRIAADAGLKSLVLDIEEENADQFAWRSISALSGEARPGYTPTASVRTGRWWSTYSSFGRCARSALWRGFKGSRRR